MSLFRRESESPASPAPASQSRDVPSDRRRQGVSQQVTHVAPGTRVEGRITGGTEVLIDGELQGDIDLDSRVVVGSAGKIVGAVRARSVRVGGRIEGNVICLERVEILESGTLEGDVTAPRVVISEGAFFKGKVEMNESRQGARTTQAEKPQAGSRPGSRSVKKPEDA